ncbi:hypothetical protein GCM10009718_32960 [Isoptericola halotolerans]|uniref:Uncharacterized protein n=1 Tax=Isoptericola halotolerans TaxID=300560 RepID=A0ABX2A6B2_9MICO|nr:hypothetical protein [Isoptericola halotolerans]NOV98184.1 hypothetical protein [Isoptericola halotolerans]
MSRAKIVGRRRVVVESFPARGGVGRSYRRDGWSYAYEVTDSQGQVVASDSTGAGGWRGLVHDASRRVAAVRTVEQIGHRLRPYCELVDEAGDDL